MKTSQNEHCQLEDMNPTKFSRNQNARARDNPEVSITLEFDHTVSSPVSHPDLSHQEMGYSPRRRAPISRLRMKPEIRSTESWSSSLPFRTWSAIFIFVMICWLLGANCLLLASSFIKTLHETMPEREKLDLDSRLSFVERCKHFFSLNDHLRPLTVETHSPLVDSAEIWERLNCSKFLSRTYPRQEITSVSPISNDERGGSEPSVASFVGAEETGILQSNLLRNIQTRSKQDDAITLQTPSPSRSRLPSQSHANHSDTTPPPPPPPAAEEPFRSHLQRARPNILWRYSLSGGTSVQLEQVPPGIATAVGAEYTTWDRARQAPPTPPLPSAESSAAEAGGAGRSGISRIWIWGKLRRLERRS
jgi:hypothetical protein